MYHAKWVPYSDLSADADYIGLHSRTYIADVDVIIACGEIHAGAKAQCDVEVTGAVYQRTSTVGRVQGTGCVVFERNATRCRVFEAGCVGNKRGATTGCVAVTGCVLKERSPTFTRVRISGRVVKEGERSSRRVPVAGGVT